MTKYLLDTNVCIELLRGNRTINSKALKIGIDRCCISIITVIELRIGEKLAKAKAGKGKFHNQHLGKFIDSLEILPIEPSIELFVSEKVRLQLAGTPVHDNFDLLIGCTAVVNDLVMVTDNVKDFKRINNIQLENWMKRT